MDKVTAAMVLTSLSTSPLVRSPPVKVTGENNVRLAIDHVSRLFGYISINCQKNHSVKVTVRPIKVKQSHLCFNTEKYSD